MDFPCCVSYPKNHTQAAGKQWWRRLLCVDLVLTECAFPRRSLLDVLIWTAFFSSYHSWHSVNGLRISISYSVFFFGASEVSEMLLGHFWKELKSAEFCYLSANKSTDFSKWQHTHTHTPWSVHALLCKKQKTEKKSTSTLKTPKDALSWCFYCTNLRSYPQRINLFHREKNMPWIYFKKIKKTW